MFPLTIAGAIAILFITIIFGVEEQKKYLYLGWIARATGNTKEVSSHLFEISNRWELVGDFKEIRAFGMQILSE